MDLLKLLQGKNSYLKKFLNCTEEFLPHAESGDFSTLNLFQKRRESALKALQFFDQKISIVLSAIPKSEKTPSLVSAVEKLLETKTQLIHAILSADQKVMATIENEKNRLLKEVTASDKNQQLVKKFKSSWVSESGEQLDGKL